MEVKDALLRSLKEQKILRDRPRGMISRSLPERRSRGQLCLTIHWTPFENRALYTGGNGQIQQAHRALGPKPDFWLYTLKEMVPKEACKKKIQHQGHPFSFDHDYAVKWSRKGRNTSAFKKNPERERNFRLPCLKSGSTGKAAHKPTRGCGGTEQERTCGRVLGRCTARMEIEARLQQMLLWQRVGTSGDTAVRG